MWRLDHNIVPTESLAPNLQLTGIIYTMFKWSFGGTSFSAFWNMGNPRIRVEDDLITSKIILLFLIIINFTICLVMWRKMWLESNHFTKRLTKIKNIYFEYLNPYLAIGMIGLSICIAWSLPIISNRYYAEMQQNNSQIYAAMRYSSFGLILAIASGMAYVFKSIYKLKSHNDRHFTNRLNSSYITKIFLYCFFPLWIYTGLVNINSIYQKYNFLPEGISLKNICDRENFTTNDYIYLGHLVPPEVIDSGVEGWLPSLKLEKNNPNDRLEEFIGKTFIQNSLRLCK